MNKKDQKIYAESVKKKVQEKGMKLGHLLEKIGISRSHWQFIKTGERPLTVENKNKIEDILNG